MAYHWDERLTREQIASIGEGIIRAGNHARAQAKVDGMSDTHIKRAVKKAEKAKRSEMVEHFLRDDSAPAAKKPKPGSPPVIVGEPEQGSDAHKAKQARYKEQLERGLNATDLMSLHQKDGITWARQRDGKFRKWQEGDALAKE